MLIGFMSLHKQAVVLTLADPCEGMNILGVVFFIATVCKFTLWPFVLSARGVKFNWVKPSIQMKIGCSMWCPLWWKTAWLKLLKMTPRLQGLSTRKLLSISLSCSPSSFWLTCVKIDISVSDNHELVSSQPKKWVIGPSRKSSRS